MALHVKHKICRTQAPSDDTKPKLLLKEGDLWTKGASAGKRLARAEDWDVVYESVLVQSEMEKKFFPLVKIPPQRGGDFQGMGIHRATPESRSCALAR
jgi:hypothetical protein